jgi:hypothetical protein
MALIAIDNLVASISTSKGIISSYEKVFLGNLRLALNEP